MDLSVFHPGDKAEARVALGIPEGALVVLFAANALRQNVWKDYRTVHDAVALAAERVQDRVVRVGAELRLERGRCRIGVDPCHRPVGLEVIDPRPHDSPGAPVIVEGARRQGQHLLLGRLAEHPVKTLGCQIGRELGRRLRQDQPGARQITLGDARGPHWQAPRYYAPWMGGYYGWPGSGFGLGDVFTGFLIGEAIFDGLASAVKRMRILMDAARQDSELVRERVRPA